MDGVNNLGRRQRKKAGTRAALLGSAKTLFEKQGFSRTTIQQIADSADVSERTFFRYFQSKDDLLLPQFRTFLDDVAAEFEVSPSEGTPLQSLCKSVEAVVARDIADGNFLSVALPETWSESATARVAIYFMDWERRLADVIRERIASVDPELEDLDLVARVAARCGVAAMRSTMEVLRSGGVQRVSDPVSSLMTLRRAFEIAESLETLPSKA